MIRQFKAEFRERRTRRSELLQLLEKTEEFLDDAQSRPRELHEYHSDHTDIEAMNHKVHAIRKRCSLMQLKQSTYNMCFLALTDIHSNIESLIYKHGCTVHTFCQMAHIHIDDPFGAIKRHFHIIKGSNDTSGLPELDTEYNEQSANREQFIRKLYPAITSSFQESLHGAALYIPPVTDTAYTVILGIFDHDKLQITIRRLPIYNRVLKYVSSISDDALQGFMYKYIQSMQLREFMVHSYDELVIILKNTYKDALNIKGKSFNDVQKTFKTAHALRQRKMLVLILLTDSVSSYAIPLLESIKSPHERSQLCESLGTLQGAVKSCATSLDKQIESFQSSQDEISYHSRIMMLKTDQNVKAKALDKLKEASSGRESGTKAQQYIDGLLKIPFGIYRNEPIFTSADNTARRAYLDTVQSTLENCVHGHEEAKLHVQRLIGQWMNGSRSGSVFGFQGPPGTGKTTLAKNGFAKCLLDENGDSRPLAFIPLGGSASGSLLEGHGYTYMGSTWGRIIDVLIEKQCMNPIIYIDEIDKVSSSERGQEIIGILTHLTDPSQNDEFNDRYFAGIKFDLSNAIFIFSYNDSSKIDKILRDRIHEIHTSALSKQDKVTIVHEFILPEMCDSVGIHDVTIDEQCIHTIIDTYTYEAGVRKLKERLFDILRDVNLKHIRCELKLPFNVTIEYIDKLFCDKPRALSNNVYEFPMVGMVNGLYANSLGIGGITRIEVHKTIGKRCELQLTGSQGKVMQESMKCARTLAWNLVSQDIQSKISEALFGLHIHCPEAATAKDGPSAGAAITIAILSRLIDAPIKNDIALTGEIDLNGNVHAIGGLEAKLLGAMRCGVKHALVPEENSHDLHRFQLKYPHHLENITLSIISNISDVIEHCLLGEIKHQMA